MSAAWLVMLVVAGLRVASDLVPARWQVSLDATSGHTLVVAAALMMSVVTTSSLLMLTKGPHGFDHEEVREGHGKETDR